MPYISLVKRSNDKRENTLNYAYAKLMSDILDQPKKRREIAMVIHGLSTEKNTLGQSNVNLEDMFGDPGAPTDIQGIIKRNNETIKEIDKAIEIQNGNRISLDESVEVSKQKLEQVNKMLLDSGSPILTNSTSIGTSRYHAYNAYSKDGLFELDRMESDVKALFDKHLGGTGAKLKKDLDAEGNDVEISTYSDLFTIVYSDSHLQKVSDFFDEFKDLVIEGKKKRFFEVIMASDDPATHYMVAGTLYKHDTVEEYVAEVAKNEAEATVAFTVNGKNDTDFLSLMMESNLSLSEIQSGENRYHVFEKTVPIFENNNEKFKKWHENPFGGTSGISKSEEGYVAAGLLSMKSFMEENPDLASLADKVIDKIDLNDLDRSKDAEMTL